MKKILFLTNSYPEVRRSASILCTHRIIEKVRDMNKYEVHVICFRYSGEKQEEVINGIFVHRVGPTLWNLRNNHMIVGKLGKSINHIKEFVNKAIAIPWYPLNRPISAFLLYKSARKIHLQSIFDLVISEHYGVETIVCGCYLKHAFGSIKHIAILWDPIKGQTLTRFLPKFYTSWKVELLEKRVAKESDLIISTGAMKEFYKTYGDLPYSHRIFLGFPGLIRPDEEVETNYLSCIRPECINIVYSGQLGILLRNPLPVIKLFNQCEKAENINLIFFSVGAKEEIDKIKNTFRGHIVNNGYISIKELHTIYQHADYLLNISNVNPNMVPSKLFEYMSYGKPIISAYLSDGDSAETYVSRYAEGLSVDLKNSDEENVIALDAFLKKEHKHVPFELVQELFKDNTPERYLEVVEKVLNDER